MGTLENGMQRAICAFDQSSTIVGWCILIGKEVESFGEFKPDPPDFTETRKWVKDLSGTLIQQGYDVTVAVEDVYLKKYWDAKEKQWRYQVHTYDVLLSIREHVRAAALDVGAKCLVIKPYDAMVALSGVTDPKTKREDRKRIMMAAAELTLNEKVSEHVSDALGLALAAYNKLFGT